MIEARLRLARPAGFVLDVDLRLPAQGVSALFGPSGCGKTTLLRALAGLERGAAGRVCVAGELWQDGTHCVPPHRRGVGLVFQDAALFAHLTVQGNLDYALARVPRAQPRPALAEAIELLGIGPLLARPVQGLSGGERQRVAVARALAMAPRILLMDEPLASLDARRRAELLPYFERLHAALTLPIVYVTHSVAEVARLADHLVLLHEGRVQASGPAAALLARLDGPLAEGDQAGAVLACTVAARDARWQLATLRCQGGELIAPDPGLPLGQALRVRVLARDVSLALHEPVGSSIANTLRGRLLSLADDPTHPAQALALVQVGEGTDGASGPGEGAQLLARLTRASVHRLGLVPPCAVWVQVKSVALAE